MLCDDLGGLHHNSNTLPQPMHLGSKARELLKVVIAQYTEGSRFPLQRCHASARDRFKCGATRNAELLKGSPLRSRNEIWGPIGDGGGAGKDLCHLVVNLQNSIKYTQRKHNEKRWIWALNSATFGTTTDSQDKVMKRDSSFLLRISSCTECRRIQCP